MIKTEIAGMIASAVAAGNGLSLMDVYSRSSGKTSLSEVAVNTAVEIAALGVILLAGRRHYDQSHPQVTGSPSPLETENPRRVNK